MGLDVSVYKVLKPGTFEPQDENLDFFVLSENPELSIFKEYLFERENEYYNLETPLRELGLDPNDVQLDSSEYGNDVIYNYVDDMGNKYHITNPPTIIRKDFCIAVNEIGYQRKGANQKFYEDGMWDSPNVTKLETLIDHWEKYFSYQTPEMGSDVEYNQENEVMKNYFKLNIIDKFVEGETFVAYQ